MLKKTIKVYEFIEKQPSTVFIIVYVPAAAVAFFGMPLGVDSLNRTRQT